MRVAHAFFWSIIMLRTVVLFYLYFCSASVTLDRTTPEPGNFDCPGDIISYSCSILSNSENLHLTWSVTIPGSMPINVSYDVSSDLYSVEYLPFNISSALIKYQMDAYIKSTIHFEVLNNVSLNGTLLECGISDLSSASVRLLVNNLLGKN